MTRKVYEIVKPFTMVCREGVQFTAEQTVRVIRERVPGDLVECGTWKGGCGMAMLLAQRETFGEIQRPVHFLDSFAGLPPALLRDGPAALKWQAETTDNCTASRFALEEILMGLGFVPGEFLIWEGLFLDTLPLITRSAREIALLRLDCDWYVSVMQCLRALMPSVSPLGTVIVDDYFAWDGCARAVHDYLSEHDLPYRIRSLADDSGAYLLKP